MSILLLVCTAVLPTPVWAGSAQALDLPRLVHGSDATVLGEVVASSTFWQGTRIYTLARVRVDELWAGTLGERDGELAVVTPGGVVGDIGQQVEGAAQLREAHTVVLHLRAQRTGEYTPFGMAQGVWEVDPAPSQGAIRPLSRRTDRLLGKGRAPAIRTLAQLKRAVLAAAASQAR